ncbi:MAG: recombination protein NinB [Acinetobacter sp.]
MTKKVFYLRTEQIRSHAIEQIRNLPLDQNSPLVLTIQERTRTLEQNAKLHAMLSDISRQHAYLGKKRNVEFWKGLFVSGWQIATNQNPEIVPGLEGEFINIRESTATMGVRKLSEVIEYIYAYCSMNGIKLRGISYE